MCECECVRVWWCVYVGGYLVGHVCCECGVSVGIRFGMWMGLPMDVSVSIVRVQT